MANMNKRLEETYFVRYKGKLKELEEEILYWKERTENLYAQAKGSKDTYLNMIRALGRLRKEEQE